MILICLKILVLVSFDVANMLPSIDNGSGIKAVKKVLNGRESKNPPTECTLEALRLLCLVCNNSVFKDLSCILIVVLKTYFRKILSVARHFTIKCRDPPNPDAFLKIQPIEKVSVKEETKLDDTLWHRECVI